VIKAIVGTSARQRAGVWVCGLAMLGTLSTAAAQQSTPAPAGATLMPPAAATTTPPTAPSTPQAASPARYTFTWQLGQPDAPAPRGGTTRGPAVTLDSEPSKAWSALQEPGLSPYERDRRAILAMAGDYRVTFDFLEVETFPPQTPRDKPYQSWGTERVYVDADSGQSISLVHILNMRIVQDDGSISEPMITKHWRQTWHYQPTDIVEYKGRDRWERRKLAPAENTGRWSQTVYQVDESPRYAGVGRWSHSGSFSSWISGDTWRPLPRREWSVRKDYQVLLGTNRHTITATGWVQEENNLKTVLTPERALDPARPYLAREYGVARYSRLRGAEVAAADEYYQRTRAFWDGVLSTWTQLFVAHPQITLRAPVDQAGLFHKLFEYADHLAAGERPRMPADEVIRESLLDMGAPVPVQARHSVASASSP
jgi:Family of unknown function (DUF6607)